MCLELDPNSNCELGMASLSKGRTVALNQVDLIMRAA
jgi:hypothetical protein